MVPGSGVPPGPLPVRLSRVPPCDVRKACSQRSGRGSSLPLCPRARERSAPSRGAPRAPDFPFPNGAQTRGTGERLGLNLGSVAPKLQAAARGLGAHIRVELGGRQIWAPAGPNFEARAELGRERKSWRRLPLEAEHAPLQAAARARFFFFFFFSILKKDVSEKQQGKKNKKATASATLELQTARALPPPAVGGRGGRLPSLAAAFYRGHCRVVESQVEKFPETLTAPHPHPNNFFLPIGPARRCAGPGQGAAWPPRHAARGPGRWDSGRGSAGPRWTGAARV